MSELTFDSNPTRINPILTRQDIDPRAVNKYKFVSDMYDGTGGVFTGDYLLSYIRESFYENRKMLASYRNFIKPIVRATIDPVFSSNIVRVATDPLWLSFLDDVDNRQTNMTDHTDSVLTYARIHGVCFTVMDNFTDLPSSQQDAISNRAYPYVYIQPAYTVESYKVDQFKRLTNISFFEYIVEDKKYIKIVTTWDKDFMTKDWYDGDKILKSEAYEHGLGVMPVVATYMNTNTDIMPQPPIYDLAKLNYTIFNKDSEIRDQERAQAFSIFYMQTDTENNNITIGPRNAIIIPAGNEITIPPGFVSPDSSILSTLMANNDKLIESLYAAAAQTGINAVKETSGIAETYKFFANNQQLKKTANIASNYEIKLSELFGIYTNTTIEYTVQYPTTFDPYYSSLSIDDMIKLLNVSISPEVDLEIKKLMASRILDGMDKDNLNTLMDTIKEGEPNNGDTN